MNLGKWEIDDLLTFPANTHAANTGAATDADSLPTYRVYEDETTTPILTGTMALLDSGNTVGFYSEQITLSAANGFEIDKSYTVYISAIVGEIVGTQSHSFQMMVATATEAKQDILDTNVDTLVSRIIGTLLTGNHNPQTGDAYAAVGALHDFDPTADDVAVVTDITNVVDSNLLQINGNTPVVDALEDQFDGTGISGDNYPATQSQMANITNTGSAVKRPAEGYTLTTGTQSANLYTDTKALNGTRHTHTDVGDALVLEYEFNVGAGIPSSVQITGALTGGNDDLEVWAYDYVAATYVQIGILEGKVSSDNAVYSYDIYTSMVGTGADLGDVKILFQDGGYTLSGATLYIDQIYVGFNSATGSYNGFIWVNDSVSNTGTVPNIDGIDTNPVSTWAAALTLSAKTNIDKFQIANGTTIQLSADSSDFSLIGDEWTLDLNSQVIANMYVENASVYGTGTSTSYRFIRCKIALSTELFPG